MSKNTHPEDRSTFSKDTPDTAAILKKIQYQLDALERKIDSLLKQSAPRNSKSTYSSKPRREYADTQRPFKQKYDKRKEEASSEGKFYHGHPFNKKMGSSSKSTFGGKKKYLKK